MSRPVLWVDADAPPSLESLLERLEHPPATFTSAVGDKKVTVGHVLAVTDDERWRLVDLLKIALS